MERTNKLLQWLGGCPAMADMKLDTEQLGEQPGCAALCLQGEEAAQTTDMLGCTARDVTRTYFLRLRLCGAYDLERLLHLLAWCRENPFPGAALTDLRLHSAQGGNAVYQGKLTLTFREDKSC